MRGLLVILFTVGILYQNGIAQLYFPNEQYYNTEIERFFYQDSASKSFFNSHQSLKPILDSRTNSDSIYFKDTKHYYWITQKLFKENFLIFKGDNFWCSVDPIVDLEIGTDFSADSLSRLYWNTRGIRVQAKFLNKVAFSTSVYENQALVPTYVSDYIDAHGEFRPSGFTYKQENAVIPGYARTKPFKTTGYDFAFAEGQVSIVPNKWINFQLGNGNQFVGNGYRSLLLSDFSVNYPFAKIETNLWDGRIQYNAIYAVHQNLYRMNEFNSVESTFERKIGTYHYLDFAITKNFQVGLFEGALWRRSDSTGTHEPNWLFANPLPFINGAVMGDNGIGYNAIIGVNYSYSFFQNRLYGQFVLDNGKLSGMQIGIKSLNLLIPNLDLQFEYNMVNDFTYITDDKRYNYSHYNLPLAHPLSSGFNELVGKLSYQKKGFFVENKIVFYQQFYNDSIIDGTDIVNDEYPTSLTFITQQKNVLINHFEIGYRFNKNYNLQAVTGWMYRGEHLPGQLNETNYIYVGVRTRLRNKTLDF
jgi:hypothetical protein